MVRKFLLMFFDTFLIVVLFVSLFQFSGSQLTGFGSGIWDTETTYFGFYSIISFFSDLGNNSAISESWDNFMDFFNWIMDRITNTMDRWRNIGSNAFENFNFGLYIFESVVTFFQTIMIPIWLIVGVVGFIIYLLVFLFTLLKTVFQLFQGKYNMPLNNSDSITEVLLLCQLITI